MNPSHPPHFHKPMEQYFRSHINTKKSQLKQPIFNHTISHNTFLRRLILRINLLFMLLLQPLQKFPHLINYIRPQSLLLFIKIQSNRTSPPKITQTIIIITLPPKQTNILHRTLLKFPFLHLNLPPMTLTQLRIFSMLLKKRPFIILRSAPKLTTVTMKLP